MTYFPFGSSPFFSSLLVSLLRRHKWSRPFSLDLRDRFLALIGVLIVDRERTVHYLDIYDIGFSVFYWPKPSSPRAIVFWCSKSIELALQILTRLRGDTDLGPLGFGVIHGYSARTSISLTGRTSRII